MNLNKHLAYRILRGGVWEQTFSCGWYQLDEDTVVRRQCRVPPGVIGYEDHRVNHVYVVGLLAMFAVCVSSLGAWVLMGG